MKFSFMIGGTFSVQGMT